MYHIIFVCKYRKKILIELGEYIKQQILKLSEQSNFDIVEIETDKDHIHLLVKTAPTISPSMIVRKLKQETTVEAWKTYRMYLQRYFWKERTFWSDGYFVCSIGNVSKDTIEKYIQEQG